MRKLAVMVCALAAVLTLQAQGWGVGAVEGTIFADLPEGQVPLEGAKVRLMGMMTMKEDITGPDGVYAFPEVKAGMYKLDVAKPGFVPQYKQIEVLADQTTKQDFVLKPFAPPPPPGSVAGHVYGLNPEGEAVPLAEAMVKITGGMGFMLMQKTLEDGSYLFEKVPPGTFKITACAMGYLCQTATIEVVSEETTTQDFTLKPVEPPPPPGSVAGHVYGLNPEGEAVPLEGATVKITGGMGFMLMQKTLEDGSYLFEKVPPGKFQITAFAMGYVAQTETIEVVSGETTTQDFTLKPFEQPEPGSVGGFVLGAFGNEQKPLEGAVVKLMAYMVCQVQKTGPDGSYLFKEVKPGKYHIVAGKEGFFPQAFEITVESGALTTQDFLLKPLPPPPGTFVGKVVGQLDPEHQVPLPGALVQVLDAEGHVIRQTMTNWDGKFFMPKLPPGEYTAVAKKQGWQPGETKITIITGKVTEYVFILKKL